MKTAMKKQAGTVKPKPQISATQTSGEKRHVKGTARASLPDLAAILGAFSEAYAMIQVSLMAISENEHSGPERVTLRLGVEALDKVYNRLDKAIIELDEILETLGKGASS
jgi:hypothetical protein